MRKINWRSGNGAIIYGSFIMLAGVMLMFLSIERGNVYHTSVYTQTRTDAIADGASEYGHVPFDDGLDKGDATNMANQINNYNNNLYGKNMSISIDTNELTTEGNTKFKVTTSTTMDMLFSNTQKNVVRDSTTVPLADLGLNVGINYDRYPEDPTEPVRPQYYSTKNNRKPQFARNALRQFQVSVHNRYFPVSPEVSRGNIMIWDYSVAMMVSLPNPNLRGNPYTPTEICEWMLSETGENAGWLEVDEKKAQSEANRGYPTIMFEYVPGGEGYAYVVMPDTGVTYTPERGVKIASAGPVHSEGGYSRDNAVGVGEKKYFVCY